MTHPRAAYRAALRAALRASPALRGVDVLTAWRHPKDMSGLPALTVITPTEQVAGATGDQVTRVAVILVVLKTKGGDSLEDDLDNYATAIEAVGLSALAAHDPAPQLYGVSEIAMNIEPGASERVGVLEVRFEAARYTAEGAQS